MEEPGLPGSNELVCCGQRAEGQVMISAHAVLVGKEMSRLSACWFAACAVRHLYCLFKIQDSSTLIPPLGQTYSNLALF